MKELTQFIVHTDKCIGCGLCTKVCPGGILSLNRDRKAQMEDFKEFGWNGCWKCEHCLAVCPTGAISIFNHHPEASLPPPRIEEAEPLMNALIANRHSCLRYQNRSVSPDIIEDMLNRLANAPNGGNKEHVEFTLIDDKEKMAAFRGLVREKMESLAKEGIYPEGYDRAAYEDMLNWRKTVRPDMFFAGAPHLLIPHAPLGEGESIADTNIAAAYFELLCASRGLGAVILTFPLAVLRLMPAVMDLLEIPAHHYTGVCIGFGYPAIPYPRGVQKTLAPSRIKRPPMLISPADAQAENLESGSRMEGQ